MNLMNTLVFFNKCGVKFQYLTYNNSKLILGSKVPSTFPALYGLQREAKKKWEMELINNPNLIVQGGSVCAPFTKEII